MADEVKIEAKTSMAKGFFTNPLAWIVMSITIGTAIYTWGALSANKSNNSEKSINTLQIKIDNQKRSQDSLKVAIIGYAQKSDALQRSYVQYVFDHSNDIEELKHSLQGVTFELVPADKSEEKSIEKSSVKPSAKIRIVPKIKK